MNRETNNQYFITTHSAHLLDATEAQIFHVSMVNGVSNVSSVSSSKERFKICASLGYKGSDILQANCIIWVEGPSDRIYLNYWIASVAPELVEGVHYSIMFYGGRLASHLTGSDPDELADHEKELISLRKLNRNSVIMIDSDKPSAYNRINATKRRLQQEFDQGPGFAWITSGREVENYLDEEQSESTINNVHKQSSNGLLNTGKWSNLLEFKHKKSSRSKSPLSATANKVKVAEYYTSQFQANLNKYDQSHRISQLVRFIQAANNINTQ